MGKKCNVFLILTHLLSLIGKFLYASISYKILHLHVQTSYNIFTLVFLFFFVLTRISKAILKLTILSSTYSPHVSYTSSNYMSISYKILHLHVEIVYNFFTLVFLFYFLLTLSKAIIEFTIPPSMCSLHVLHTWII